MLCILRQYGILYYQFYQSYAALQVISCPERVVYKPVERCYIHFIKTVCVSGLIIECIGNLV